MLASLYPLLLTLAACSTSGSHADAALDAGPRDGSEDVDTRDDSAPPPDGRRDGTPPDAGFSGPAQLVVQDNLWFRGPPHFSNYRIRGESMVPVDPLLGRQLWVHRQR